MSKPLYIITVSLLFLPQFVHKLIYKNLWTVLGNIDWSHDAYVLKM